MEPKPRAAAEVGRRLTCINPECGEEFIFSNGEQEYFKKRNLDAPKRCKKCRELRKREDGVFGSRVVIVDSETDRVLCGRCRQPASRMASLAHGEPICATCADYDGVSPDDDTLVYDDWKNRKGRNPYVS